VLETAAAQRRLWVADVDDGVCVLWGRCEDDDFEVLPDTLHEVVEGQAFGEST
jgi:hypothetical protein